MSSILTAPTVPLSFKEDPDCASGPAGWRLHPSQRFHALAGGSSIGPAKADWVVQLHPRARRVMLLSFPMVPTGKGAALLRLMLQVRVLHWEPI